MCVSTYFVFCPVCAFLNPEQAKANMIAAPSQSAKAVVSVGSASSTSSMAVTTNTLDDKRKLLVAQMREKAAAEALRKADGIPSLKATMTPILDVQKHESPAATQLQKDETQKQSPMETYEMSDRGSSSSEDEDSEEEEVGPKKKIPKWAQKESLQKALDRQFGKNGQPLVDPDEVFGVVYTCDLSAIFGESKRYNKPRKETGDWKNDKITPLEKLVYKRDMGYD